METWGISVFHALCSHRYSGAVLGGHLWLFFIICFAFRFRSYIIHISKYYTQIMCRFLRKVVSFTNNQVVNMRAESHMVNCLGIIKLSLIIWQSQSWWYHSQSNDGANTRYLPAYNLRIIFSKLGYAQQYRLSPIDSICPYINFLHHFATMLRQTGYMYYSPNYLFAKLALYSLYRINWSVWHQLILRNTLVVSLIY